MAYRALRQETRKKRVGYPVILRKVSLTGHQQHFGCLATFVWMLAFVWLCLFLEWCLDLKVDTVLSSTQVAHLMYEAGLRLITLAVLIGAYGYFSVQATRQFLIRRPTSKRRPKLTKEDAQ